MFIKFFFYFAKNLRLLRSVLLTVIKIIFLPFSCSEFALRSTGIVMISLCISAIICRYRLKRFGCLIRNRGLQVQLLIRHSMAMNSRREKKKQTICDKVPATSSKQRARKNFWKIHRLMMDLCVHTRTGFVTSTLTRWKVFCFSRANTHTHRERERVRTEPRTPTTARKLSLKNWFIPQRSQTFLPLPSGWMSCGRERKREKKTRNII